MRQSLLFFISSSTVAILGSLLYFYTPLFHSHIATCTHTDHTNHSHAHPPNAGFCGFDAMQSIISPQDQQLQNQLELQLYNLLQKGYPPTNGKALYTIPVVVHVVHNNGPGNIPNSQAISAIQHLNDAFANVGVFNPATGVDVEVQFCMAQRDPSGNTTNGITNTVSTLANMNMNSQDLALKNLIRWDPLNYINIWVVNDIQGGVVGYAVFPSSHGNNNDGIVMEAAYMGTNTDNSKVLVHEIGHYLGLYHTFQGGCTNNDCLVDGDRVCDTPPDNTTAWVPCTANTNSCQTDDDDLSVNNPFRPIANGGLGDQQDQKENYMDYSDFVCYDRFTQGQKVRMHFFLTGIRASLLGSQGCLPPCTSPINIGFTSSATTVVTGTLVNFTNTTTNGLSYEWFNNGVSFANTTNSSFTFNTIGTFNIVLQATNGDPNCTLRDSITIIVTCGAQAAFTTSSTQISPNDVVFFTNNSTGATSYEWYIDNVLQGTGTSFNFTFPTIGTYDVYLVASNGSCDDTTAIVIISVIPSGLAQTGLPVWPLAVSGNVNPQTVDWRDTTPIINNVTSTTTNGGQTGAAFNECGQLAFYALHTGSSNADNLFIYAADGTPLLTNATANAPGLDAVKGGQEIQVIKVPLTTDEWYIIYKKWTTDVGAPASNGAYTPANWLYSRVQYTGGNTLTILQRDIPLLDGIGTAQTYTDGAAVSRTAGGVANQHYLYLCRRTTGVNTVSLDRFLITNTNITFSANTGNVAATWWSLGAAGSPIELSPTEDRIAVVCRNQYANYTDIVLFDAALFNAASAIPISLGDLVLQPDGTPIDQSSVLNISGAVDVLAFNIGYPLGFLRNMEKKMGGIEFSPNGRFLYITGGGYPSSGQTFITYLGQIDLDQSPLELRLQVQTPPVPPNMLTGIGCLLSSCGATWDAIGTIESCYDGNLYYSKRSQSTLFVIPDPNSFMPQNLVPSDIDLATTSEPNIIINTGQPRSFPDQIDGFNYLASQFTEVELIVRKYDCFNDCDTFPYTLEITDSSGAVVESFTITQCPDTINFCADTSLVYSLRDTSGLNFPNAVFYGHTLCPNPECIFDFTNISNCSSFTCGNSYFQTLDSSGFMILHEVFDNPVAFSHISNLTTNGLVSSINSIAYHPLDNFIYGINHAPPFQLYRINTQGVAAYLGNVTGLSGLNYAGCMDANGTYYVTGSNQQLYTIDINTLTATSIGLTNQTCSDMAFNPSNGLIYGFDEGLNQLFSIDPSTAASTLIGAASTQFSGFGAFYFNAKGEIIAYGDDITITATGSESLVKIDPSTGNVTPIGIGPEVSIYDGCSCPFGVELTKEAPQSIQAGNTFTYTFKIFNQTGLVGNNVQFNDILNNGLVWASEPQNLSGLSIGTTTITGSNSAIFIIDSIQPGLDSFSIQVTVPCSFADTVYTNMAFLSGLSSSLAIADTSFSDDPNTLAILDSTDITITSYPSIGTLDLGPDTTLCENGVLQLNAGSGFDNYLWQNGHLDSFITASSIDFTNLYWVEVSNICGDTLRDSIFITFDTIGLLTITDTTICLGDSVNLSFNSSNNHQWFPNQAISCNNCATPSFSPTTTTTYTAVASNSTGCISVDSFTITVDPCLVPIFTYLDTSICFGATFNYNGNILLPNTIDTFQFAAATAGLDSFVVVTVTGLDTFNTSINLNICLGDSLSYGGQMLYPNTSTTFNLQSVDGCDSILLVNTFAVDTSHLVIDTAIVAGSTLLFGGQSLAPNTSTTFNFQTVDGCDSTIVVNISEIVLSVFNGIPNAFSPNNDGVNEKFFPLGLSASDIIRFRVFNRWGQEVYNGDELQNGGWDGRYMGADQPKEVYIFLLEYNIGGNSAVKMLKGEVTLMR